MSSGGYVCVSLKRKIQLKHRLIAFQFIENDDPENKTQIDHINRNKNENRIEKLRWCTVGENVKNREKIIRRVNEYLDHFPENAIEIAEYEGFKFKDYYYDPEGEQFIKITRWSKIKIIQPRYINKLLILSMFDIYNKTHNWSYNKLVRTVKKACDN